MFYGMYGRLNTYLNFGDHKHLNSDIIPEEYHDSHKVKDVKILLDILETTDNKLYEIVLDNIKYTNMKYFDDIMKIINDKDTIDKLNKMCEKIWIERFYKLNFRKWKKFKDIKKIDYNWKLLNTQHNQNIINNTKLSESEKIDYILTNNWESFVNANIPKFSRNPNNDFIFPLYDKSYIKIRKGKINHKNILNLIYWSIEINTIKDLLQYTNCKHNLLPSPDCNGILLGSEEAIASAYNILNIKFWKHPITWNAYEIRIIDCITENIYSRLIYKDVEMYKWLWEQIYDFIHEGIEETIFEKFRNLKIANEIRNNNEYPLDGWHYYSGLPIVLTRNDIYKYERRKFKETAVLNSRYDRR